MEHIIGATFDKVATYKNDAGVPQNITNIDIQAQAYTMDRVLLGNFVITKLNAAQGTFRIRQQTISWPDGTVIFDFRFLINGNIVFTDKQKVNMVDSLTKPL